MFDTPFPFVRPIDSATFKQFADDFVVTEHIDFIDKLSQTGEHLWLYVKKTGVNTHHLITLIAKWAKVAIRDVGYSGLKDRHATTFQWFSVHLPKHAPSLQTFDTSINAQLSSGEHVELIRHAWHNKKLHRGTHKTNHFTIILRHLCYNHQSDVEAHLTNLATLGAPNYVGEQRFGQAYTNLKKASALLATASKKRTLSNHEALLVSSVRSHLFNLILAKRVLDNTWNQAIEGDVFNLNGTGSLFTADIDDTIIHRIATGDIHPTAPLFGVVSDKDKVSTHKAHAIEQSILAHPDFTTFTQGLHTLAILQSRRALRLLPTNFTWHWLDANTLTLTFTLPRGSFATTILSALCLKLIDASQASC